MARLLSVLLLVMPFLMLPSLADDNPGRKLRVIVFGGHPDDPESGAGGLIATLTAQDWSSASIFSNSGSHQPRFKSSNSFAAFISSHR